VIIAIPIKALPVLLQINGNGFCHFEVPRKRGKTPKVAPANVKEPPKAVTAIWAEETDSDKESAV
jgi:hypothetical protein